MSLSLLDSYGLSSDDEEEHLSSEETFGDVPEEQEDNLPLESSSSSPVKTEKPMKAFFSSECSSSSSGGEGEEDADDFSIDVPREATNRRLPSAHQVLSGRLKMGSSVFVSETEIEEAGTAAMLSKHVPLSEQAKREEKGGRKRKAPCRAFMNGTCNRGNKCRFSHVIIDTSQSADTPVVVESKAAYYNSVNEIFSKKPKLA